MPEYTDEHHVKEVNPQGLRGPLWTLAGTAIGGLASMWLGGGLNGLGCHGGSPAALAAGGAGLAVLAEKEAKIARLESEKYTDGAVKDLYAYTVAQNKDLLMFATNVDKRLAALETAAPLREQITEQKIANVAQQATCCCNALQQAMAGMQATLASITKTVVPNGSVCPGWGNVTITPAAATTVTP